MHTLRCRTRYPLRASIRIAFPACCWAVLTVVVAARSAALAAENANIAPRPSSNIDGSAKNANPFSAEEPSQSRVTIAAAERPTGFANAAPEGPDAPGRGVEAQRRGSRDGVPAGVPLLQPAAYRKAAPSDDEEPPAKGHRSVRGEPPWGGLTILRKGSSEAAIRRAAISRLALESLPRERRGMAMAVVDELSLFRRLPTVSFTASPEVYRYFLSVPQAAVDIWRALDVSEFRLASVGPDRFHAKAADGSNGELLVLRRTGNSVLVFCEGQYATPLLPKPIVARALIHLQFVFREDAEPWPQVVHTADLFVSLPSQPVETVAKVIAPISNLIADRNFEEVSQFVQMMDFAMRHQPGWVRQLSTRFETVSPPDVQRFLLAVRQVQLQHRRRGQRPSAPPGLRP